MSHTYTATQLEALGYGPSLVSVIPPGARLAPSSKIRQESVGKAPGCRYMTGLWGGYNWQHTAISAGELEASGANIGLRAGEFPAIDIDVRDEALADFITREIRTFLCIDAPLRIGSWPKRLFAFRTYEPFGRMQMFVNAKGERHLIEILGHGQQYVISGVHPKTSQPYVWSDDLPYADDLPPLTHEKASDLFIHLMHTLIEMEGVTCEWLGTGDISNRKEVVQDGLKATSMNVLEMAVDSIPNTNDTFPSRETYIKFGYAIKGATQDDPGHGLAIYTKWALKWEGNHNGANTPETVAADWERMRPPFSLGADYVFDVARKYGFDLAVHEFPVLEPDENPIPPQDNSPKAVHSDLWLADRFVSDNSRNVRYVPAWKSWLAWDGTSWRQDISRAVPSLVSRLLTAESNTILAFEPKSADVKRAERLSSARTYHAVERLAQDDSRIISSPTQWDTYPDALATPAGVVDLRTGAISPADPGLFISRITAVTPERKPHPRWSKFMREATGGNEELEQYLQRMMGYCLTGHTKEHALFFMWGEGGRGKGTFLNTLTKATGQLTKVANMATFTASKNDRHTNELAALAGSRMVVAQETQSGRFWDQQRIKAVTGGDPVTARFLFQEEFTYIPAFKLVFTGNTRPHLEIADAAMRRRIHLIPFDNAPQEVNLNLQDQMVKAELPAILQWAIDGAKMWYESGLLPPEVVVGATDSYFEDEDPVGSWIKDCCVLEGNAATSSTALYDSWVAWCNAAGDASTGTRKKFMELLMSKGLRKYRTADERGVKGIKLK